MDVVVRATEIGKEAEAVPWIQELQALTVPEGTDAFFPFQSVNWVT
jgi:hypothetical protein